MAEMMKLGVMEGVPVNTTAIILGDNHFVKSPAAIIEKTKRAIDAGLTPQIAVYSDADIDNARRYLIDSGIIQGPSTGSSFPVCRDAARCTPPRR